MMSNVGMMMGGNGFAAITMYIIVHLIFKVLCTLLHAYTVMGVIIHFNPSKKQNVDWFFYTILLTFF